MKAFERQNEGKHTSRGRGGLVFVLDHLTLEYDGNRTALLRPLFRVTPPQADFGARQAHDEVDS